MTSSQTVRHLAIIMDGNRRWAKERHLPEFFGHTEGAKNLKTIAEAVRTREIPYLTVYAFSTENLRNRSSKEIDHLFSLLYEVADYLPDFHKHQTRLRVIGDLSAIPERIRARLEALMEDTCSYTAMTLTLAINYGGRDEILRAINRMMSQRQTSSQENDTQKNPPALTEKFFSTHLDTAGIPDVDLMIRTGGDQRTSNFLLWQSIYAELYFTPVKWPAFTEADLDTALRWFQEQKRNGGA